MKNSLPSHFAPTKEWPSHFAPTHRNSKYNMIRQEGMSRRGRAPPMLLVAHWSGLCGAHFHGYTTTFDGGFDSKDIQVVYDGSAPQVEMRCRLNSMQAKYGCQHIKDMEVGRLSGIARKEALEEVR